MRYGELSNRTSPHIVIVFENVLAFVPDEDTENFRKNLSKGRTRKAFTYLKLSDIMLRKLLDVTWRLNLNVNIVTWMGEEAAGIINEILERESIPVRGCFSSTPEILARNLPYNPEIVAVYDPDPNHVFTYGSKGVLLKEPEQIGRIYG